MLNKEVSTELCRFLTDMEADLNTANEKSIKNRLVTTMFIRTTFAILFVVAIVDGFLLHTLSDGIKDSLHHVDVMSKDFNTIAENMSSITLSVNGIDNKMTALSHISDNVFTIGNNMELLTQDMDTLVITFNGIENEIQYMDTSILFVDNRVRGMSHDMHYIGQDMNNMARPIKWMNKFMPW